MLYCIHLIVLFSASFEDCDGSYDYRGDYALMIVMQARKKSIHDYEYFPCLRLDGNVVHACGTTLCIILS